MPRLCGKDCRSALKFTNTGPRVCIELITQNVKPASESNV